MSANNQPLIATIYNPQNQSKEALIAGFIARKQKFERIFRDIRDAPMIKPEQHYLIQGIRGMGKTTLLLRIAYEIDNTPELRQRLVPILFNEEEYGIGTLSDIWERTAQYLGETDATFADLYEAITKQYGEDDYEQIAFQTLINSLQQQGKKLLLLIDNIGDVLKKLDNQEGKRLREILLTTPELRLIGATSVVIEQVHDYAKPFYEFFKVIHLNGLSREEATELFLNLGETYHTDAVKELIERQPGRIEAIRRLTGGVIRTMVLLFEILVENDSGSVFRDLNVLLDRVTPLYKHRLDDLPAQQQKIVAALAQAWDAASAKELAQVVRLESKVVSAQLKQLINNGVVEKVETNTKNHLYRLEERFFNIWYLMRFGRRTDQRVFWLIRFFETMFDGDPEWMQERIDGHLKAMEIGKLDPEAALYLTTAFSKLIKNEELEDLLITNTRIYLIKLEKKSLAQNIPYSRYEEVNKLIQTEKYKEAIDSINSCNKINQLMYLDISSCYFMLDLYDNADASLIEYLYFNKETQSQLLNKIPLLFVDKSEDRVLVSYGPAHLYYISSDQPHTIKIATKVNEITASEISFYYFLNKKNDRKVLSLKLLERPSEIDLILSEKTPNLILIKKIIELWNNTYESIEEYDFNLFIPGPLVLPQGNEAEKRVETLGSTFFKLLLAKKQYHIAYNYFQQEEWQLKDRFKPLYYATLYFLKDEYPTEYLRMGPELKETVNDVLAEVAQMAIDYA
ncbi:ATP-binding protein [Spirosoma pomorum]